MQNYTKEDIIAQLKEMKAPTDSVVLVHTSLRSVGQIEGGAQTLLDALIEYFTNDGGLLCVPTHTWHNFGKDFMLDMEKTDTALGAFSDIAASDTRGVRSEHPTHSMMVFGDRKKAEEFVKDEPYITSYTSPDSCYGKLYKMGGYIMLVGVAHNRNTYLHAVEEMLKVPDRMKDTPTRFRIRKKSGEVVERELYTFKCSFIGDISLRFVKYETPFRYHRCITDGFVGNAPTQLCDAVKMKETMELIFKNSKDFDPLDGELPIEQKLYCTKSGKVERA